VTRAPNVLWICTDQQRYDTIGALGNPSVRTPTIDGLVASGVAFERAYAQSPICTPSRASFLTGRYPSSIGVNRNGNEAFPADVPLLPRLFADAGYDCGLVGKLHLASAHRRIEPRVDDGYRFWQYSHAPRDDWPEGHDYADWVAARGFRLADLVQDPAGIPAELHQTTWCAERTIDFITQERSGPWFVSVNFYDPHPPFVPPRRSAPGHEPGSLPGPRFRDADLEHQGRLAAVDFQSRPRPPGALDYRDPLDAARAAAGSSDARSLTAAYYAMIEFIDEQVGRILAALDASGQRDDTLVIFMSDHGEMLGDHGLIQKGCRFYEGLVRVPLILSYPRAFVPGLRSTALVELIDLAPTLLESIGLPALPAMQGVSLLPIARGERSPDGHRTHVRSEYFDALALPDGSLGTMFRDDRYKLSVYHGHERGELYDLVADPDEFHDLWDDPAAQDVKLDLLKRSFDAAIVAMDKGSPRRGPM